MVGVELIHITVQPLLPVLNYLPA